MKRTQIAREVAAALHESEASLEAALTSARGTLARMLTAKEELGLTGTMGDAAQARVRASIAALEAARADLYEGHREAYQVMQATHIRGVGATIIPAISSADEDTRAA